MTMQRLIGGLVMALAFTVFGMWHTWFGTVHAAERVAGVAIELGADIQDMGTPELAHYLSGITAAQGTCNSVTNARRMGEGVRIACDRGTRVYFLHAVNGVLFVSDITESGR